MIITSPDLPWAGVSHNEALRKQVYLGQGEVPRVTQFARSVFPPGEVAPGHSHPDMWEVFLVTRGTLTVEVDGQRHELATGSTITLAPGEHHELRNEKDEDLELTYFGILQD
ncbi:cupin domain-containing protein [Roseibacillus ishigakijimensis]|uniref:Cupin domain-containing protein n=1 Tax=Roseibacillus ishigakijimensis TaxID=454146 RepID=A0A934RT15_9BACT|nr:cupin domain-containing protein [Roseibacillus ishigakijimensis]MBK1834519.1 cupin domain-containing protein [Roseibacillus ishigakijimensis]